MHTPHNVPKKPVNNNKSNKTTKMILITILFILSAIIAGYGLDCGSAAIFCGGLAGILGLLIWV